MKKHPLLGFLLLTFLITWGISALYLLFPAQLVALTRKDADRYHPLFVIAACALTLSAFAVVMTVRYVPALVGHAGSSGSWLFHCPELDLLLAGTVDQAAFPSLPYKLLPRLLWTIRGHRSGSSRIPRRRAG